MNVAEVTLKQLREAVDEDEGQDAELLKFVMDTSELPPETEARIIIHSDTQFVTYAIVKR